MQLRVIAVLAVWVSACGARTGLEVAPDAATSATDSSVALDAGPPDAGPVIPPVCGEAVAVGEIRARASEIDARPAVGDDRNLYTARRDGDAWLAVSLDPCLRERWSTPIALEGRAPRLMHVAVDDLGDVWVVADNTLEQWRFSSTGEPLTALPPMDLRRDTWVGLEDGAGPVYSVFRSAEEKRLVRADRSGEIEQLGLPTPSSFVWNDECAVFAGSPTCFSIAFDRAPLRVRWQVDRPTLVDGTLRHVTPPATDGTRMWAVMFGISTYDLVAIDLATGARAVRVPLMRTSSGQSELLLGPAVVAEDGTVIVYRHGSGVPGALSAHGADGIERWSYPAARARRSGSSGGAIFDHDATHLIGRGGLVYLAMGDTVHAVRIADGSSAWRLDGLTDVNEPAVNLSPNGDLYVLDAERTLYAIATDSAGLAPSPWPIPGGGHRLAHAR